MGNKKIEKIFICPKCGSKMEQEWYYGGISFLHCYSCGYLDKEENYKEPQKLTGISQRILNLIEGCEEIYRFDHGDTILLHKQIMEVINIHEPYYYGKSVLEGMYEPLLTMTEVIEKEQLKELKHAQKEAGKFIMEIVEKEFPEIKGKFTVEWENYEN